MFIRKNKNQRRKPIPIGIENEYGCLIASSDMSFDRISDYLIANDCLYLVNQKIIEDLKESDSISLLRSICVEDKFQGNGFGRKLMEEYLSNSESKYFILIADLESTDGLIDFYGKFGYEKISENPSPIMLMVRK